MKLAGYSNYEIYPETGKIWSYAKNRFIGQQQTNGYWVVLLKSDKGISKTWRINRLIWTVVNGEIPEGMQINHNDEDKNNNSISNLSLMTPKENINWGTGNHRRQKTLLNGGVSKSIIALQDGIIKMYFPSTMEAQRNGFSHSNIQCCCAKRKYWNSHKGYQWQYVDDYLADWWDKEMNKGA